MRFVAFLLSLAAAGTAFQTVQPGGRRDWVDPATGHRIVRLTGDAGGSTLYFHDNAFSPEGDKLMFSTPGGIAVVDVAKIGMAGTTPDIVTSAARGGYFARRSREIYFQRRPARRGARRRDVMAVNVDTMKTREVTNARGLDQRRRNAVGHEERHGAAIPMASTRARRSARPCRSSSACFPASGWKS